MAREYFCAYHSMLDQTKRLSDAELGRLFRALLSFSAEGVLPQGLNDKEAVAFDMLSSQIKRDIETYEKQCKKNAANGSRGGRPRTKKSEKGKQNKASDDDESEKTERFSKKPKKANGFLKSQEEEKEKEEEEYTLSDESVKCACAREEHTHGETERYLSVREISEEIEKTEFDIDMKERLRMWAIYKGDAAYTAVTLRALLLTVEMYSKKHGSERVRTIIGQSISNSWKNICFVRLDEGKATQTCESYGSFGTDEFFEAALRQSYGGDAGEA